MTHSISESRAQALIGAWSRGDVLAEACPSRRILQHLTSRWGTLVMVVLATGPQRFSGLKRQVKGVSERMLSQVLKDLEADGFVLRTAHPVMPPHVDYQLTPLGEAAAARLIELVGWIEAELATILAAGPQTGRQAGPQAAPQAGPDGNPTPGLPQTEKDRIGAD
ncbi:helix-turn-helix transcriptional regulator [Xinfangfangia sp. D13-10-4-6]|uniref:winged helix-turn-helix transcriptional regulator n=1 Tax=Pseudogemmobacter hezensis TaxID=2737662 RepID=UPI001556FE71|nr:helix-turn-helix domain-containing protein [Pseudogemmobacter hezensis]NPD16872.1 helix-turn-helix transcriptional regulator [Pseudogemmobacter hezensis]